MSDPKDESNDFPNLFDMADFDHEDDQETEDYFANKAKEESERDSDLDLDEDQDQKTQTMINTDQFGDSNTNDLENKFDDSDLSDHKLDDSNLDDFSNFEETALDDQSSYDEITQVNFDPQNIFDSENEETDEADQSDIDETGGTEVDDTVYSEPQFEQELETEQVLEDTDDKLENIAKDKKESSELPVTVTIPNKEDYQKKYQQQYENFEDIQKFANTAHYSTIKSQGNPSFSMIISDIKYQEDSKKIFSTLDEFGFINSDNKEIIQKSLDRGSAIISRVSEFAAYFLYHQIHLLDIKLQVGPSDLIYSSSVSEFNNTGIVGALNLLQNKEESQRSQSKKKSSILISTSAKISGYAIKDFLGTCRESIQFQAYPEHTDKEQQSDEFENIQERSAFQIAYREAELKLKKMIQDKGGNAGVDMKVEIIPLFIEEHQNYSYQVALQCHAVWIDKTP